MVIEVARVSLSLPRTYIRVLHELVGRGYYSSVSEAVRDGIRMLAEKYGIPIVPERETIEEELKEVKLE